jgi:hypothetical protein
VAGAADLGALGLQDFPKQKPYEGLIMKTQVKQVAIIGLLAGFLLRPCVGSAEVVGVQTETNPSNAAAGESGASIGVSALISVLVIKPNGGGVSNLGDSIGDGTSGITLPTGWTLTTGFNVAPGGCLMSPTQFTNGGGGIYTIRVVPFLDNPSCQWLSGEYHYVVRVNVALDTTTFRGRGLGVLRIP